MLIEYLIVIKYLFFCLLIASVLFILSYLFVFQKADIEKNSAYECGFNPFGDARSKFEVKFYLIGILFIIFDLEVIFLFPWVVILHDVYYMGICVTLIFLLVLTIGFIFELGLGVLNLE